MSGGSVKTPNPAIRALIPVLRRAGDEQIMRIVEAVDAVAQRGQADLFIEPLRDRLASMRPPHPLRFGRLMFYPLDLLIVPDERWQPGRLSIPRSALMPMAEHVRLTMGAAANTIIEQITGHTTADTDLISGLGWSFWPQAAAILSSAEIPQTWRATPLGEEKYRPLANTVATLLTEAATIDSLHTEAATGLLPPKPEAIEAILYHVVRTNKPVLPMMLAVLLDLMPQAAELLPAAKKGSEAAAVHAAMPLAADVLLRQLDREDMTDARIATGTLAEAGIAACRIARLLKHLDTPGSPLQRRKRIGGMRKRLDANCRARFATGLQDEFLTPLQQAGTGTVDLPALETAARGLRVLEAEARMIGSGAIYDRLLRDAASVIKDSAMLDRLSKPDQVRLVELLSGPDAALALLDQQPAARIGSGAA